MSEYPVCDTLYNRPTANCAPLFIVETFEKSEGGLLFPTKPSENDRSATITFVEFERRVFGITCWHVISNFRALLRAKSNDNSHSMYLMTNGQNSVIDRFIRPQPSFAEPVLDIALREFNPDLLKAIGKIPIKLDITKKIPNALNHAYAVGFPEKDKRKVNTRSGHKIVMQSVEVLAEITTSPQSRFSLHSELSNPADTNDLSGMSGGPIYWATQDDYGMLGIIYEGRINSQLTDQYSVNVFGEFAGYDQVCDWIKQLIKHDSKGL